MAKNHKNQGKSTYGGEEVDGGASAVVTVGVSGPVVSSIILKFLKYLKVSLFSKN